RIDSLQRWRIAWTSGFYHVRYAGAPSDGSTRRCHVTPYYARAITLPRTPSPVGVQCTRHQENSAGPKPQTLPNFLGAGRAFLPVSKPVTVRVGRRPPQPLVTRTRRTSRIINGFYD